MTAELPSSTKIDAVADTAVDYFERRNSGEWSDAEQAEFHAWLAQSDFHLAAYLRLEGIASYAERVHAAHPVRVRKINMPREGLDDRRRRMSLRFFVPLLAAASVALIATFGWPLVTSLLQPPDRTDSTDIGGRTLLSFADRTQIELNTETAIRFRMTSRERIVWLEKGEAWFHVAHDAARPFTVIVGTHRITDLGTEFVVHRNANNVDVALVSGRATLSTEGVQTATLIPGDEAVATSRSLSVTRKTPQELADELAWRQGMLVFRKTPLAEVAREFNRYNTTKVVIADPSIANVEIVANLRANDFESFLQIAHDVLGLHVERQGSVVFISRETQGPKGRSHSKRVL